MDAREAIEAVVRLKECLKKGTFSAEQKNEITLLYREVLGKEIKVCNCKDRYSDALIEVYLYLKRNDTMKTACRYRLKSGVVIQVFGKSGVYTNDNLTDEVAVDYLKKYPKAVDLFEYVPHTPKVSPKRIKGRKVVDN